MSKWVYDSPVITPSKKKQEDEWEFDAPVMAEPYKPRPSAIKEFGRGVVEGLASTPETIGTLAKIAGAEKVGGAIEKAAQNVAKKNAIDESLQGSVVDNPELLKEPAWWTHNIGQVMGSIVGPVGAGGSAAAIGKTALKKVLKDKDTLAKATKYLGIGAAGGFGGAMEGSQTYNTVLQETGDKAKALRAGGLMAIGSAALNSLSFGTMLSKATKSKIAHVVASGIMEGATEQAEEPWDAIVQGKPDQAVDRWIQGFNVFLPAMIVGGMGGGAGAVLNRNNLTHEEKKELLDAIEKTSAQKVKTIDELATDPTDDYVTPEEHGVMSQWVNGMKDLNDADYMRVMQDVAGLENINEQIALHKEAGEKGAYAKLTDRLATEEAKQYFAEEQRSADVLRQAIPRAIQAESEILDQVKAEEDADYVKFWQSADLENLTDRDLIDNRGRILEARPEVSPEKLNDLIIKKKAKKLDRGIIRPIEAPEPRVSEMTPETAPISDAIKPDNQIIEPPASPVTEQERPTVPPIVKEAAGEGVAQEMPVEEDLKDFLHSNPEKRVLDGYAKANEDAIKRGDYEEAKRLHELYKNPPIPTTVYRGISRAELEGIKKSGTIKSNGSGNFDYENDKAHTLYTGRPYEALSYADGFTMKGHEPTPDKPGYVIEVLSTPGMKRDISKQIVTNESVPVENITRIIEVRPEGEGSPRKYTEFKTLDEALSQTDNKDYPDLAKQAESAIITPVTSKKGPGDKTTEATPKPDGGAWGEYLSKINPGNKKLQDSDRPRVYADDLEGMADDAKLVKTYANFKIKTDGESFYATKGNKVVGYVSQLSDNEIDLTVAHEYQKQGIGTALLFEFRKRNPFYQTGGLTDAGLKTERRVFNKLSPNLSLPSVEGGQQSKMTVEPLSSTTTEPDITPENKKETSTQKAGYVFIKRAGREAQYPFTEYREITKGKNKGKVGVTVRGREFVVDRKAVKRWPGENTLENGKDKEVQYLNEEKDAYGEGEGNPVSVATAQATQAQAISGTRRSRVARALRRWKRVDFVGWQVRDSKEVAELFSVFRNPSQEYLHQIYVNNDGKILHHTCVTSGALDHTWSPHVDETIDMAKKLGAIKVYELHNHPGGNPLFSKTDIDAHKKNAFALSDEGIGFESIVIDHDKFSRTTGKVAWETLPYSGGESFQGGKEVKDSSIAVYIFKKALISGDATIYLNSANRIISLAREIGPVDDETMRSLGANDAIYITDNMDKYSKLLTDYEDNPRIINIVGITEDGAGWISALVEGRKPGIRYASPDNPSNNRTLWEEKTPYSVDEERKLAGKKGRFNVGLSSSRIGKLSKDVARAIQVRPVKILETEAPESSREPVAKYRQTIQDDRQMAAGWMTDYEDAADALTRKDKKWMEDNLKTAYEKQGAIPNERIQRFVDAWTKIHNSIGDIAKALGVQEKYRTSEYVVKDGDRSVRVFESRLAAEEFIRTHKRGDNLTLETRDAIKFRPFTKIERYFPHILTPDAKESLRTQSGEIFDALVQAANTKGFDLTPYLEDLDIKNLVRRNANLEHARQANMPEYVTTKSGEKVQVLETDPFKVIPASIEGAARRLAFVKNWGPVSTESLATHEQYRNEIAGEAGSEIAGTWDYLWQDMQGRTRDEFTEGMGSHLQKTFNTSEAIARSLMLSMAQISNVITGPVPIMVKYGFKRMIRAYTKLASRQLLNHFGVKMPDTEKALDKYRRMGGWAHDTQKVTGDTESLSQSLGGMADTFLKKTGMEAANRFLNKVANFAAHGAMIDAIEGLKKPDNHGFKRIWGETHAGLRAFLKREGEWTDADIDRMVKDGPSENDITRFVQRSSTMANVFMERAETRPQFMKNGFWRRVFAYTSYYRMMGSVVSDTMRYAKEGNYRPLMTLVLGAAVLGTAEHEIKDYLKGIIQRDNGNSEELNFAGNLLDSLAGSGALAMPGTFINDIKWWTRKGDTPFTIPQVQWWGNVAHGMYNAVKKGVTEDAGSGANQAYYTTVRNVPLFRTIDNMTGGPYKKYLDYKYRNGGSGRRRSRRRSR